MLHISGPITVNESSDPGSWVCSIPSECGGGRLEEDQDGVSGEKPCLSPLRSSRAHRACIFELAYRSHPMCHA